MSDPVARSVPEVTRAPILVSLRQYMDMPGSVAMLELCMRDVHHPRSAEEVAQATGAITWALRLSSETASCHTVVACVSMAATLHKLLNILVCDEGGKIKSLAREFEFLISNLIHSMVTMEHFKGKDSTQLASNQAPGYVDQDTASVCTQLKALNCHQIQSILMKSWFQLCQFCSQYEDGSYFGMQQELRLAMLDGLEGLSTRLQVLGCELLYDDAQCRFRNQAHVDSTLERYAISHFHGRLLPGCCFLGCTNLDGVSEAALKTKLCGGCRRVRYCSVECQKAAWVNGGHRKLCKVCGS